MGYAVKMTGHQVLETDKTPEGAYKVTENGVLQLLKKDGDEWVIISEISPHAWVSVSGKKYSFDTADLPGQDGRTRDDEGGSPMVIL